MISNKTAIVFPGQGSQIVGMGKDLYDNFLSAKEVFQMVDEVLGINLSNIMFNGPSEELTKTQNTQPALMAVSMAVKEVLEKDFNKEMNSLCSFVAGHSLGEYSALCATNAISLQDTAKLLQIRGNAMSSCGEKEKGSMAAILGVDIDTVKNIVNEASQKGVCQIANDNSVGQIVISGSQPAILRAIDIAKSKGAKRAIELPVSGAFHCSLMAEAEMEMQEALSDIPIKSPSISLIANITAQEVSDTKEIKDLLVKQVTGTVRWRESMLYLENKGITNIVEFGSGKVLSGLVGRTCKNITSKSIQNTQDIEDFVSKL